jgi:hypothetical protein
MQKYPFLRFATIVLRVLGWIILVVGVIGSIVLGIGGIKGLGIETGVSGSSAILLAVAGVIASFLTWLFLLATRELIYLLVNVEDNTRITAENTGITAQSITKKSR